MGYRTYAEARAAVADVEFSGHYNAKFKTRSEFASVARNWSQERFNKEIRKVRTNYQRRERYSELRDLGISSDAARVGSSSRRRYDRLIGKRYGVGPSGPSIDDNLAQWAKWAEEKNYRRDIESRAEDINIENGYDKDANYGWAVMHYVYVYGYSVEFVENYLQTIDKFGDVYKNLIKSDII